MKLDTWAVVPSDSKKESKFNGGGGQFRMAWGRVQGRGAGVEISNWI